ncbi:MAG: hypothetical protein JO021_16485 [Alphaproteobacteria bacterium]|nr:hypothetical protein [Alphaproteobacteria bacterium]
MTLKQFKRLLDAYGADVQRWPAEERRAARALLAHDPAAQAAQHDAAELDRWLDAYDPPSEAGAAARVAAELVTLPPQAVDWRSALAEFWWELRSLPRVPAIVAVVLLGFLAGVASMDVARGASSGRVDFSTMLFEPTPSDWLQL